MTATEHLKEVLEQIPSMTDDELLELQCTLHEMNSKVNWCIRQRIQSKKLPKNNDEN